MEECLCLVACVFPNASSFVMPTWIEIKMQCCETLSRIERQPFGRLCLCLLDFLSRNGRTNLPCASSCLYSLYLEICRVLLSWDLCVWSKALAVLRFHVTRFVILDLWEKRVQTMLCCFQTLWSFPPLLPVFVACLWKDLVCFALELGLMWMHSASATVCSSMQELLFSKRHYSLFMVRID